MQNITPADAATLLANQENVQLLDVREDWEYALVKVDNALHIPLNEIPNRLHELDKTRPVVALCHHGMRSAHACHFLAAQGFVELINIEGGIDAWAAVVDPALARY